MKITVIGHLCLDVILHPDGTETQSYGGIFFSVAALANLLGSKDTVAPVFGVGKGDYDALIERLTAYPNVDRSGIYSFNGPTNRVRLIYSNTSERTECSKRISEPIPLKKIRPHLDGTMILVNMISGFDITLETFDEIRMGAREESIPIYLDVQRLGIVARVHVVAGCNDSHLDVHLIGSVRSEERRVGKECTSWCRSRWSPYH